MPSTISTRTEKNPTVIPKRVLHFLLRQAGSSIEIERPDPQENYRRQQENLLFSPFIYCLQGHFSQ
jgi:hypothetical protein